MAGKLLIKKAKESRKEAAKSEDKWENWTPKANAYSLKVSWSYYGNHCLNMGQVIGDYY